MSFAKHLLCVAFASGAFFTHASFAASWQENLSSAASQLSQQSGSGAGQQQGGMSLSSLTGLLNGGNQSLSASTMNNAAGVMSYCAKHKLASLTNTDNIKNQVLDKLGLSTQTEQQKDPNYLEGLQGMLNTKNGEQLNLNNIGSTPLAEKVKTKACDIVLKQGVNFLS
ncbi:TPA: DUF2501 domain-containing protein [Kluyvera intermedia]|uniref:DUF2501 domain-containing protein n=1 Tax=Phytobacter ursingii TaxID=1972431 RepID=A0AB35RGV8_9ENTR|nr:MULTISPECIES: DUF2501 domain-containing protein [Enterobacteriaceae]MDV2861048.1 DUF2501 domain-containing protein [Phytobacter ursingii]GJL37811.1 hypothetical protein TUM17576_46310 [Enterobacter hormaechei]HAT2609514.1 DUF2501 domain-containing protein [Kluyvera intermedia]